MVRTARRPGPRRVPWLAMLTQMSHLTEQQETHRETPRHVYLRVHRSSPAPPLLGGLALRPLPAARLPGCHPVLPAPSVLDGLSLLSILCPAFNADTRSLDARRRCMKLQNPPRLHSPFSFWRQQDSRKSVTGDSSEYSGRPRKDFKKRKDFGNGWMQRLPAYQRLFKLSTAVWASVSHSYRAYTLPMR